MRTLSLAFLLSLLASCATGPPPQEMARLERERAQRLAQDEQGRNERLNAQSRLLRAQQDVTQSSVIHLLSAGDVERAAELLSTINSIAGEELQDDSVSGSFTGPSIAENPKTIFSLDIRTGKLVFHLTPTISRELLLSHVDVVNTLTSKQRFQILQNEPTTLQSFFVRVFTKEESVRVVGDQRREWAKSVLIEVKDSERAAQLEAAFKDLVALFPVREYGAP